ncbi:MAG: hypothetical protein GC160_08160 [Acidobacteria bacterium]|nr:hypothetical protein [Acidobacteriota bacterium]
MTLILQLLRRGFGAVFPGAAEKDPAFRAEIDRLSVRALWTIGWINLVVPVVAVLFHSITELVEPQGRRGLWSLTVFPFVGLLAMSIAKWPWGRSHARALALLWALFSGVILTGSELYAAPQPNLALMASSLHIVLVLLVTVVATPAKPWQILLLAAGLNGANFGLAHLAAERGYIPGVSLHLYAGLDLIALLCTGLAALNYQRVLETYRSHRSEMEAQSRLLVSDNAAALGKFAATLSHQLNSPLGVLESAIDSLEKVSKRRGGVDDVRLQGLAEDLFRNARGAAGQLEEAVRRMQRFTNLDRAEAHPVDLEQLLRDVTSMVEPDVKDRVRIDLQCERLPKVTLRPQQMSAVFAKLLQNAVQASDPDSTVELRATCSNGAVEVRVSDQGRGLDAAAQRELFEPAFHVRDGKVVGGHWGLFTARQAVREQGGDIAVRSEPGKGSEVVVTLPRDGADSH